MWEFDISYITPTLHVVSKQKQNHCIPKYHRTFMRHTLVPYEFLKSTENIIPCWKRHLGLHQANSWHEPWSTYLERKQQRHNWIGLKNLFNDRYSFWGDKKVANRDFDFNNSNQPAVRHGTFQIIFAKLLDNDSFYKVLMFSSPSFGDIDKPKIMEQSTNYTGYVSKIAYVYQLRKSIYALRQEGEIWKYVLHDQLINCRVYQSKQCSSFYFLTTVQGLSISFWYLMIWCFHIMKGTLLKKWSLYWQDKYFPRETYWEFTSLHCMGN